MIPRGGWDRVDAMGNRLEQKLEELPCGLSIRLIHELGNGEIAGPVNAYEEIELALDRLNLGDVDVE